MLMTQSTFVSNYFSLILWRAWPNWKLSLLFCAYVSMKYIDWCSSIPLYNMLFPSTSLSALYVRFPWREWVRVDPGSSFLVSANTVCKGINVITSKSYPDNNSNPVLHPALTLKFDMCTTWWVEVVGNSLLPCLSSFILIQQ